MTGAYVTSLNMPGFSVSLLRLPREGESAYSSVQILELVDAPADSHGWHWFSKSEPAAYERIPKETKVEHHIENVGKKLARESLLALRPPLDLQQRLTQHPFALFLLPQLRARRSSSRPSSRLARMSLPLSLRSLDSTRTSLSVSPFTPIRASS